jgi:hypothetical protein
VTAWSLVTSGNAVDVTDASSAWTWTWSGVLIVGKSESMGDNLSLSDNTVLSLNVDTIWDTEGDEGFLLPALSANIPSLAALS